MYQNLPPNNVISMLPHLAVCRLCLKIQAWLLALDISAGSLKSLILMAARFIQAWPDMSMTCDLAIIGCARKVSIITSNPPYRKIN
jgi:hypothetical protein